MMFAQTTLLAFLMVSANAEVNTSSALLQSNPIMVSTQSRSEPLLEAVRERARMLRNNELTTEDPLDNAILYKRLKSLIAAYEAGKISDNVLHMLLSEFQTISHTGVISHQMAQEWLTELKPYLK